MLQDWTILMEDNLQCKILAIFQFFPRWVSYANGCVGKSSWHQQNKLEILTFFKAKIYLHAVNSNKFKFSEKKTSYSFFDIKETICRYYKLLVTKTSLHCLITSLFCQRDFSKPLKCKLQTACYKWQTRETMNIYLFKVKYKNIRTSCEICSKLSITTSKQCRWCHSGIFIHFD